MITNKNSKKFCNVLFALILLCLLLFFIWKAPFGYHSYDESLYTATAYRHIRGDPLLADEWNPVQFSSFLLSPILRLYLLVHPTTEGIILHFRYIYAVFHCLSTAAVYALLRKKDPAAAIGGALIFALYAPHNIMALSYNTMGVGLSLLCVLLAVKEKPRSRETVLAGMLFAGAVLCVPYLVFVYFFYSLAALLPLKRKSAFFSPKVWLRITLGISVPAAAFFIFGLRGADWKSIAASLPYVLNPAQHTHRGVLETLLSFLKELSEAFRTNRILLLYIPLIFAALFDRKQRCCSLCTAAAAILSTAAVYCLYASGVQRINSVMIPLSFAGLVYLPYSDREEDRPIRQLYLSGWILSLCFFIGSNTGIFCISSGLCLSAVAAAYLALRIALHLFKEGGKAFFRKAVSVVLLLSLTAQVGVLSLFRKNRCYGEPDGRENWYCPIDYGCGKGEICGEDNKLWQYDRLYSATEKVREAEGEYVLYFTNASHLYLMDTKKCACFSAWLSPSVEEEKEKLLVYWQLHQEKKPDAIFIDKYYDASGQITEMLNTEHFPVEETDSGYILIRPGNES